MGWFKPLTILSDYHQHRFTRHRENNLRLLRSVWWQVLLDTPSRSVPGARLWRQVMRMQRVEEPPRTMIATTWMWLLGPLWLWEPSELRPQLDTCVRGAQCGDLLGKPVRGEDFFGTLYGSGRRPHTRTSHRAPLPCSSGISVKAGRGSPTLQKGRFFSLPHIMSHPNSPWTWSRPWNFMLCWQQYR